MTDGRIENDSRIGTEGGGRETEGSIGTVDLIEIGGCIESKSESALRPMDGSSPLVGNERD